MSEEHDVFLSHNSRDKPAVRELAEALRERGLAVWLDEWELVPGRPWQEALEEIIETVRTAAVLVGRDGLGPWEEPEMRACLAEYVRRKLPVIPVLLPGAPHEPVLPIFLRAFIWVDLRGGITSAGIDRLEWGITERKPDPGGPAAPASTVDPTRLESYLKDLVDRTDHINISGISSSGSVKGALRHPIERLYTPLRSRELRLREGGAAPFADERPAVLSDLLPRHQRLLIEGQPGAGKTTFLRFVACMLARDALGVPGPEGESWRRRHLGLREEELPPTPVMVRIADVVTLFDTADGSQLRRDDRRCVLDVLDASCRANDFPIRREEWRTMLERGEAVLLLDGLDEVAGEALRGRLFEVFRDACRGWPCPIVVASRPIHTAALAEMGFHTATIEPFGESEIGTFIDHWVAALHAAPSAAELGGEGERYRQSLRSAIVGLPRVRRLATNPVMLTCLCVVHWNEGQLPEGRSRVYRAVIRWLVAARRTLREEAGFTDRFAWRALARLALAMVDAEGGKRSVFDLEEGAVAVDAVVRREFPDLELEQRRHRARRWLRFECLGSGIVEEVPGKRVRFWHLTFQEFLAALQLAWRGDGHDPEEDWWPLVERRLDDAQWRETVDLFPGCLLDEGGEGRVDKLLDRVLELRGEGQDLASEARIAGVVGRLLQPLSVYQYRPRPEITTAYREALDRSLAIFTVEGASVVPIKVRIAAAEALGRGGDPRLAAPSDNFLQVPGCGGLRIGKYPVTVEEYQRFVDHRGYEERKYWSDDGWAAREEESWDCPGKWDEQLETPNRPVTILSWYEAVAYCRWLSEQRNETIRLPTEAEWEMAATPEKGEYPWGEEEPDEQRANFRYAVGSPTPVGVYPAGEGPWGHCDLAGNVWEWCADVWSKEDPRQKVLRGGGWSSPASYLQAAFRNWLWATVRGGDVGFRVSVAPPSS